MRIIQLPNLIPSKAEQAIWRVSFSPSGEKIAVQSGLYSKGERLCVLPNDSHVIDIPSNEVKSTPPPHPSWWHHPTLSKDGQLAVEVLHWSDGPHVVRFWEPWSGKPPCDLLLPERSFGTAWVAFAPTGLMYLGMNPTTFPEERLFPQLVRVDPAPVIRHLSEAGVSETGDLKPLSVREGAVTTMAPLARFFAWHSPPAFDANGRLLAAWSADGWGLVLECASGRLVAELPWKGPGSGKPVRRNVRLDLSPDGNQVAMVARGTLICQRLDQESGTWKSKTSVGHVTDVVFHPDGHTLFVTNSKGEVHRLDAATGRIVMSLDLKIGLLLCVAINSLGSVAAVGNRGGHVALLDIDF